MKTRIFKGMVLCLFLISMVAAIGTTGPAEAQTGAPGTVTLQTKTGAVSYLADSAGMALYYFTKDSPGKSACSGGCLEKWPLFYAEKITPPSGTDAKDFGTITREDGKKQTTYKGYPLYYFANDKKPGDANGQGINNVWYTIDPKTFKP
jgi:predicted lipoprotein with Yx(FWY)xxD motif